MFLDIFTYSVINFKPLPVKLDQNEFFILEVSVTITIKFFFFFYVLCSESGALEIEVLHIALC